MSHRATPALLQDLLHHAMRIQQVRASHHTREAFVSDRVSTDAVLWNLLVLGEVCKRLGEPFHEANPVLPWRSIIAQRNLLAHGYDIVDWEIIANVVEGDIPVLIKETTRLLSAYGTPPTV